MRAGATSNTSDVINGTTHRKATMRSRVSGPCPYLGIVEDPATSYAFPTPANCCFRTKSSDAIELQHQQDFCLTSRYTSCRLFQESKHGSPSPSPAPWKRLFQIPAVLAGNVLSLLAAPAAVIRRRRLRTRGVLAATLFILLVVALFVLRKDNLDTLGALFNGESSKKAGDLVVMAPTADRPIVGLGNTPTPSPTPTSAPPMATATPEPTSTPMASPMSSATPTPTLAATSLPTADASPSATVTSELANCGPPASWVTYVIQPGENLFRISLRYNITVSQMMRANCLPSTYVYAGQRLSVPFEAPVATEMPAPTETASPQPDATSIPPTDTPLPSATAPITEPPSATPPTTPLPTATQSLPAATATAPLPLPTPETTASVSTLVSTVR